VSKQLVALAHVRRNYSFKCHRYDIPAGSMPGTPASNSSLASANSQHVFAVNDICFHKGEGTFGTAGADGSITFWDGIARTKLKRERDRAAYRALLH
jgi:mRNA export factor